MKYFAFILNLPWTVTALIASITSLPYKISFSKKEIAIILHVKSLWWYGWFWNSKGVRALAMGHVVLLSPKIIDKDVEHELIHVEQAIREPFIHPFLYIYQTFKNGYRKNKYEVEAYEKAGNVYLEK
jgi:hypothetical protein